MIKLIPHYRTHIPNGLAVFAALLLLFSGVVGYDANRGIPSSDQDAGVSAKTESAQNDALNVSVKNRSRGLKFNLLFFRRG